MVYVVTKTTCDKEKKCPTSPSVRVFTSRDEAIKYFSEISRASFYPNEDFAKSIDALEKGMSYYFRKQLTEDGLPWSEASFLTPVEVE